MEHLTPRPGTSEPLQPGQPAQPAQRAEREDRFLRGQLHAERSPRRAGRSSGSSFLRLLLLAAAAAAVWAGVTSGRAPELEVERILVEGNVRLTDGEIRELVEVDGDENILTLDLDEMRRKLLRSAWIQEVELKRVLPGTLTLEIVERSPVAIAILDELYLLAEDGTILDQLPPYEDLRKLLPARGLVGEDGKLSAERAALAGRTAKALLSDERLSNLISELDVSGGAGSVELRLREPPVRLLVAEETMTERLLELVPLLSGLEERVPSLEVVDLRFRKRAYLRTTEPFPGEIPPSTANVPGGAPF